jgi:IMP dehydrogenase
MKNSVCFDDVLLVPRYSTIRSRSDINLSVKLENVTQPLRSPIISSPMDTITESAMALAMLRRGSLGIIHRFNDVSTQANMVSDVYEKFEEENCNMISSIAAAIGVSGDYFERAQALYRAGARILCVDIAHGHHILMKDALQALRREFGDKVHLMAGNVATREGFEALADWGANSVRVGIGGGSICSTRIQTGHGMPTLQSVLECSSSDRDALIIADGGIRTSGDMVKALAAGADMVMVGALLSGTAETPGDVHNESTSNTQVYEVIMTDEGTPEWSPEYTGIISGRKYKQYRGMASQEAQIAWRGYGSSEEGVATTVDYKGPVAPILDSLERGIRSGLSYSDAMTIADLQARSVFTKQTFSGVSESSTHILNKG